MSLTKPKTQTVKVQLIKTEPLRVPILNVESRRMTIDEAFEERRAEQNDWRAQQREWAAQRREAEAIRALEEFRDRNEDSELFSGVIAEINKLTVIKDLKALQESRTRDLEEFKERYAALLDLPEVAEFLAQAEGRD
jgi:hypothetical protein